VNSFARLREVRLRQPWWGRWLRRFAYLALLGLVASVTHYAYRHHQVTTRLQEALDELDRTDPGWRLQDIEAARAVIPDDENSAACVLEVARLLPPQWPASKFIDAFDNLDPPRRLAPEAYARLRDELNAVHPALEEARKLEHLPNGRHRVIYRPNLRDTLLQDQEEVRQVTLLLALEVVRCGEESDLRGGVAVCQSMLNAARSIGDEPLLISQMIRSTCSLAASKSLERLLAQGEAAPEALATLQRLLEQEDRHRGLLIATRGERAMHHELFDAIESGKLPIGQVTGNAKTPPSLEPFLGRIGRDKVRAEHSLMLSIMTQRIAVVGLAFHEQAEAEKALSAGIGPLPRGAVIPWLAVSPAENVRDLFRLQHALLRCLAVALAAERYRRDHGNWPASAEQLAPQWIAAVPLDPFDGQPLRYRRLPDGVVVYSVGPDRQDNGGELDRADPKRPGSDLGCRLWDVKHRRQPPPPEVPDAGKQ
jgi:hypothetical protein